MPEIKLNIPFPLERDGVEYEATGEFRCPEKGELYLNARGQICTYSYSMSDVYFPILRPAWQWPAWVTAPFIAKDFNGIHYAYLSRPVFSPHTSSGWRYDNRFPLSREAFDFQEIPGDWRDSLRENPKWEETDA